MNFSDHDGQQRERDVRPLIWSDQDEGEKEEEEEEERQKSKKIFLDAAHVNLSYFAKIWGRIVSFPSKERERERD